MSNPEKPSGKPSSEDRTEELYREGLKRAHEVAQSEGPEIGQLVVHLSDPLMYELKSVENGIATVAYTVNNSEDVVKQFPYAELINPKEILKGALDAKVEAALDLGPVLTAEEIEKEELERYEWWMANNPVVETTPQNSPEVRAEKAAEAECEAMLNDFEKMFNLEALRAITRFSSKEERENSYRQPALEVLSAMFKRMKVLSGVFDRETREALGVRYEKLSNAVGNITIDKNGNIFDVVVHNRRTPYPGDELPR